MSKRRGQSRGSVTLASVAHLTGGLRMARHTLVSSRLPGMPLLSHRLRALAFALTGDSKALAVTRNLAISTRDTDAYYVAILDVAGSYIVRRRNFRVERTFAWVTTADLPEHLSEILEEFTTRLVAARVRDRMRFIR